MYSSKFWWILSARLLARNNIPGVANNRFSGDRVIVPHGITLLKGYPELGLLSPIV